MTSTDLETVNESKRIKIDPSAEFLEKLTQYKNQLGDNCEELDEIVIQIYFEPKLFTDGVYAKVEQVSLSA